MNDRPTHEELEALIAGDRTDALEPDEMAELALMADILGDPSTWAEPSAGLEDSIVRAVAEAERTPGTAAQPAAPSVVRERVSRRRRFIGSFGAAAASIAIIVGALVATQGGTSPQFTAQLSATGLAPGAHATVDISKNSAGFRVTLDARGLPRLPSGHYYQAWLKNAAGTLVPIGTFSSSDARVTLWSGVSPKDFPNMSITIEARDGVQDSSGRKVLIGAVHAT